MVAPHLAECGGKTRVFFPGESEDIYRVPLAGGVPVRLTFGDSTYSNSFPAGSPVDDRIAFVRQRRDGPDPLFVFVPGGEAARPLATPDLPVLGPPAWSPDGSTILISAGESPATRRLYEVGLEGDSARALALPHGMFDCGSYAPTGDEIVASRAVRGESQVVVFRTTSSAMGIVTASNQLHFHCPEWSRATGRIGATAYSLDYATADLVLIDTVTGDLQPVDTGPGYANALKWSPDGDWLTYQCTDGSPSEPSFYGGMEICLRRDGDLRDPPRRHRAPAAHPESTLRRPSVLVGPAEAGDALVDARPAPMPIASNATAVDTNSMNIKATVTEVIWNFSDYLNRVAYRGERFVLTRGARRLPS